MQHRLFSISSHLEARAVFSPHACRTVRGMPACPSIQFRAVTRQPMDALVFILFHFSTNKRMRCAIMSQNACLGRYSQLSSHGIERGGLLIKEVDHVLRDDDSVDRCTMLCGRASCDVVCMVTEILRCMHVLTWTHSFYGYSLRQTQGPCLGFCLHLISATRSLICVQYSSRPEEFG